MCCPTLQGVDGGTITLHTKTLPKDIRMWHATTLDGKRRDFRLITGPEPTPHPVFWFEGKVEQASHWVTGQRTLASLLHWHAHTPLPLPLPLPPQVNNYTFVASQPVPDVGWTAFFIQVGATDMLGQPQHHPTTSGASCACPPNYRLPSQPPTTRPWK